jgi:Ni,Fe-hydrogenase III small subunit
MVWHTLRQIVRVGIVTEPAPAVPPDEHRLPAANAGIEAIHEDILALLGRALAIRQVDAGSCNGCELEIHALNNPYYNIEGKGIKFVASPRHADLLLVTGPVAAHMEAALRRTYDAVPAPKRVVAIGECACNGGVFGESYASRGRVANVIPVDVAVDGCPPPPVEILRGILRALRP